MKAYLTSLAMVLVAIATATAVADDVVRPASERFALPDTTESPEFRRHVLPLLGRSGCNGRACHGSFQGQGGFRLSLFGYDLEADHLALASGDKPRVDLSQPRQSLILQKPTLGIDHEGGERIKVDSWQYRLLLRWIETGANKSAADAPEFARLEVTPTKLTFAKSGDSLPLAVTAVWSDGSREDVTPLCRFRSNDDSIAVIDEQGVVTAVHPGDTHVVAFYDNGVVPVPVLTPVSELLADKYPKVETPTRIDELVTAKLRELGILPADICSDAEFLRRTNLDICGTLPAPAEIDAFLADTSINKRNAKIEELLGRPTYAAWWTTRLCDYTGNNAEQLNEQPFQGARTSAQWYMWLFERVKSNSPYDQIVAGMVLANSRQTNEGYDDYCREMSRVFRDDTCNEFAAREAMPFYWLRRNNRKPEDMAQAFAHAFLGVRIQCAQCHKHPFDQWTKRDYEEFTAFFRRVRFGISPDSRKRYDEVQALYNGKEGPKTDINKELAKLIAEEKPIPWREVFVEAAKPSSGGKDNKPQASGQMGRFLDGERIDVSQLADPRQALVDWLRSDADRYFARAFVNRVWANYFHRGIIDPPDDLNRANPPCNEALLDYLTRGFIEHQFDMKWLHREIATSRTYQLSYRPNETNRFDTRNFSRAVPRRLPAEVAYNALTQATARTADLVALQSDPQQLVTGSGFGPTAKIKPDKSRYALAVFGRPPRATTCDCERSSEPTLLQTLYLQNDNEALATIERNDGWLKELMDYGRAPELTNQVVRLNERLETREKDAYAAAEVLHAVKASDKPLKQKQHEQRLTAIQRETQQLRPQIEKLEAELQQIPTTPPPDDREIVRQAYLRTVSRLPSDADMARSLQYMAGSSDRRTGVRDLLWALINTKEFILNH